MARTAPVRALLAGQFRIDSPPARLACLICSNSSTHDRAIPASTPDGNDAGISSRVGPELS
jgi:hypothetical protein